MRLVLDAPRLLGGVPRLRRLPRGSGLPVQVLPGFGAGDASTWPLRQVLRALGHDARGWGLGVNRGEVEALIPRVTARVRRLARTRGAPVALVGWSLGGVLAREAAREAPEVVARVVTLGTPVVGGPKYTTVGRVYARRGVDLDALEAQIAARNRIPICVPVTAVYTRGDGVVAWQACLDPDNDHVEHVEVAGTHVGLGLDPAVWAVVAERLARAPEPAQAP